MLGWGIGFVTCASRCICFDDYSGKALFWLVPLLASRLSVLGSLELAYKRSHIFDARADAAELELSPDLRRIRVMI